MTSSTTVQRLSSFSTAPSLPRGRNLDCLKPVASGSRWLVSPRARRMAAAMISPSQRWRMWRFRLSQASQASDAATTEWSCATNATSVT